MQTTGRRCIFCQNHCLHFTAACRLGAYDSILRAAVLRMKDRKDRGLALALGDLMAVDCAEKLRQLSRRRRGAGADALVAPRVAGQQQPHHDCGTYRGPPARSYGRALADTPSTNDTAGQSVTATLTCERAWRVCAASHRDLPGSRLLLVDDIMTTGATLDEAAKVHACAAPCSVAVAVIARASGEN